MDARRRAATVLTIATLLVGLVVFLPRSARRDTPRAEAESAAEARAGAEEEVGSADAVAADNAPDADERPRSGTVLDRATRTPVAGARVFGCDPLRERTVPLARSAVTDEEGRFALDTLAPGDTHVQAVALGFMPAVEPTPAEEILLDRGLSISGVVVDDENAPLPDATVWAHREGNETAWPGLHRSLPVGALAEGGATRTGPDGTFRIEGLHAGTYVVRAAKAQWCFPKWSEPPRIEAGATDAQLKMWPTHTLVVEHRDKATGEPIRCVQASLSRPAAALLVHPMPGDLARGESLLDPASQGFDPETATTRITFAVVRSRAELEWDVRRFPPQRLFCTAPGYAACRQEVIAKGPGETRIVAAMEAKQPGAPGAVRMEAFFAGSNRPFEGLLQVSIDEGTSATRGTAVLRFEKGVATDPIRLPPGAYKALAAGHGDVGNWWCPEAGPRTPFTLPAGAEEIRVRLELRGNPVRLHVRDAEGREARGYDLIVNPAGGASGIIQRWDAPSNHAWAQRWRDGYAGPDLYLPPGEAKLCAILAGAQSGSVPVTASGDGSLIDLSLTLR